MKKAMLVLKDGTVFEGYSFGAEGESIGEVVFNTSMTGYQEILTDPSYKGQIVVMTYTQIGNYGVNDEDVESYGGPKVEGFVVREYKDYPSNWRAERSLEEYLKKYGIVGIQGIDTRALTKHLRDKGAQMGILSTEDLDPVSLYKKVLAHPDISEIDHVSAMMCKEPYMYFNKEGAPLCVVYDYGVKLSILRNLKRVGFSVYVVPGKTPAEYVLEMNPSCVMLSNGPGDPQILSYALENVKKIIGKKPLFGICLGHQLLGLALGGRTYKLKFGHHGGNHPVKDLKTGRISITAQNHNYCVDIASLKDQVRLTHKNLYDGTEEGMEHVEYPIFSVQHHPEAGPGPNDALDVFERFMEIVKTS
ncbi:MAG: glutamine-hydrolyzing carbamoyl-phosphate synthase small subunit [Thermodesulfovibrio sp.]|jgi:carbamoyl-phosphate synthase small subunit|uniref:Carbamoyl phosphate synthase small chain n=2 Tax=Thermodesulfovibrio TaxID=28261 RepID=A0A2J6WGQ3_9BACT|nr:MAG: carbamoyl phosphate synthase small subunit [Thermodesulfovibrio aggregans]